MTRWSGSLAMAGMLLGLACGDSGGPVVPKTLLLISGDHQVAGVGATLPQPLVVIVVGSDGNPFANATVDWTVTSGVAALNPTSAVSDVNGRATTTVTFASTTGGVAVSATVAGVTPVTFTATVLAPGTLAIASGDAQTGPASGALLQPLKVTLLSTTSDPYPGATVIWAVASGSATLTPPTSVTDTAGQATTLVQLGASPGPLTVTATVAGLPAVTFSATAVPPCTFVAPYTIGAVVQGTLATTDCVVSYSSGSFYYDFYGFTVPSGQQSLSITMGSSTFNTWIDLYKASGLYFGGAASGGLSSHLDAILGAGNYVIGANSYDPLATGGYALSSAPRAPTVAACQVVFATRGITLSETVMTSDCKDSTVAGVYYSDILLIALDSGDVFEARLTSGAFDPYLYLYDLVGQTTVAFNDDSAVGTLTSYVSYTSDVTSIFLLDLGTAVAGQTGGYALTITGPAAGATATGALRAGDGTLLTLPFRPPPRGPARSLRELLGSAAPRPPARP